MRHSPADIYLEAHSPPMKNQYFGDTRDLFKHDLVLDILSRTDLRRFTFVPMLTPNDETTDGVRVDLSKGRAGVDNMPLREFLEGCTRAGRRDVRELDAFFVRELGGRYELLTYGPLLEEDTRFSYFDDLPDEWLRGSVVVLDPDNGMEIPSNSGDKWLRYHELRQVYDRMDDMSVLLVFQYIPRVKREVFMPEVARRMVQRAGVDRPVHWVSDNEVVFYSLAKGEARRREMEGVLAGYADRYGLAFGSL